MKRLVCTALGSFLMGCGSTNDVAFQNNGTLAPVAALTNFAGRVVNESGAPQAGVQVVVHERTSNFKSEGVSGADGTFVLSVLPGVYDVGLDKNGDKQTASCFYGPFDTSSAQQPDLVLHNSAGRPVDQLFGKIWLRPAQAAVNRQVTLRPAIELVDVDTEVPAPVTMNTAGDGSFALQLGSNRELGLDVEVYDGVGALDEWIDVGKRDKPCYVEFTTEQSPVENRLRANQSELLPETTSGNKPFGALGGGASVALIPFTASLPQSGLASLDNGQLPVDKVTRPLADIVLGGTPDDPNNSKLWGVLDYGYIRLDTNGSWWWKYAVNIYADRPTKWSFTDATNDTYTLWISNTNGDPTGAGMHKVSYNSSSPTIKRIQYKLSI